MQAVQGQNIQLTLDHRDEWQEVLAVEPVLVEFAWRAVRCGHNGHGVGFDQRGEQPAHDHGIGRIVDHHLVESQQIEVARQCRRYDGNGIAAFAAAGLAQPGVDFEHEGVEVNPAFALDCDAAEEQIHQHRLAATDPAPQIDPALIMRPGPAQPLPEPGRLGAAHIFELGLQTIEPDCSVKLLRIGSQLASCDKLLVTRQNRSHRGAVGLRMVPE